MKAVKLLIFVLILLFSSIIIDYQLVLQALPPGNCLKCLKGDDGSYTCQEASSGYINCDKSYQPCKMTTICN